MIFTFLLKYWKYVLGLVALSALGAIILVLHMELSAAQSSLVKARTELATVSQALHTQNTAVARASVQEHAIQVALTHAEHRAQNIRVITRTLIKKIYTTPVGPTCTDAMDFLRKEATFLVQPIPGQNPAGG